MKSKGFTLIELAVVLAIIAVLAAVLTPVVTNYVDQSRIARAMADVRTVADAIKLYRRDTGYWPIFANLTAARADNTTTHKLIGPGQTPAQTGDWSNFTTSSDLVTIINTNIGFSTASQVSNPGRAAFRGPYIGALDADPWGNTYVVTALNLDSSSADRAFVVSAGPNGTLDVDPQQGSTSITNSTDDLIAPIN